MRQGFTVIQEPAQDAGVYRTGGGDLVDFHSAVRYCFPDIFWIQVDPSFPLE